MGRSELSIRADGQRTARISRVRRNAKEWGADKLVQNRFEPSSFAFLQQPGVENRSRRRQGWCELDPIAETSEFSDHFARPACFACLLMAGPPLRTNLLVKQLSDRIGFRDFPLLNSRGWVKRVRCQLSPQPRRGDRARTKCPRHGVTQKPVRADRRAKLFNRIR